ncbi:MAG: hypothetical protein KAG28_08280 [Cocleimonas sp.]|nr:hypothetical protein [Cocleimonas sp.]
MNYQINPLFHHLTPLITDIETHFQQSDQVLHAERNEIRVIRFEAEDYVVKSFKIPNYINRFAYRYLRASKAKRSYQYSLNIGKTICPEAIAYCEKHQYGFLSHSYFISRHFNYDFTIRPLLMDKAFANRQHLLEQFAEFTYQLHQQGILHRDYSPGNVLIKKQNNRYHFKIIDVNRMQFKTLTLKERLSNFSRLMVDDDTLTIILKRYAQKIQQPPNTVTQQAIKYRDQFAQQRALKNKLRGR